jgi:serine/threonine protein kinase/DNA-binding SARP family transcriptional activator/Tol biopolymer transport system component
MAQPKRLALLVYLAANTGTTACRRDRLLGLFWPELDEHHARKALNKAVHFLRHEIGAEALVSRNGDGIEVDPTRLWCDVAAFQSAVKAGDSAQALELYAGDLLPSFYVDDAPAFDEWMEQERTRLRLAAAGAARTLATAREHEGKATIAISLARRAAALSDLDERMVRHLLALLDRLGDRAGALEVYDRFAHRLRDEFDAEPAVETKRLMAEIRVRHDESPLHGRDVATLDIRPTTTAHFTPNSERALFEALRARGYHIERELGHGAAATVYLARDAKHDRPVALKLLSPEIGGLRHRERFFTEIRVTAQLQHPNILPVFDSGDVQGVLFYVMPFVDGESLRSRLAKGGALSVPETVSLLRDVAKALAYAHERGVVHRDIKPDNVLLTAGTAIVADFGIAKAIAAAQGHSGVDGETPTHVSMSLGTPAYMAPEQAAADPKTDHRADIYAWGCTAYEMLAGRPPFAATSPQRLLAAHLSDAPTPLGELRHDAPTALCRLVMQCLEKDPGVRPKSAAQLVQALNTVVSGQPISVQATPRARISMRAKAIAAMSVVAVAVAVAIAAFVLYRRSLSSTTPLTRQQITYTGRASWPALSPDGKTIAFVEAQQCPDLSPSCTDSLVVQDVAGGRTAPLAVGTSIIHPKWNPDGRSVLFQATRVVGAADTAPGEYLVSFLDRAPRRIGPGGAAFNTRGDTIVFGSRVTTRSDSIRLRFLRSADLEVLDSVSLRVSGRFVHDLDWSPDGKWLALIVYRGQGDRRVFLVSRRRGMVTDSITVAGRQLVRWVPNGDAVLLLLQDGASDDIVLRRGVDRRTGHFTSDSVTKLKIPVGGATFGISRDGKTMAVVDGSSTTTQFTVMERVGEHVTSRSLPTFTGWSSMPALSPDGRTIALSRGDAQGENLYLIPFEGGPERPLTSGQHHVDAPVWLRDGRLVFKRGLPSTQLFVVNPRGGQPRPFGPSGYTTGNPWYLQWLDDSLYVLDQWDEHRLLVVDSSGSVRGRLTVPDTLSQLLAVTPDARQLWFLERNSESRRFFSLDRSTKLVTVDRSTKLVTITVDIPPNSQPLGWADDTYVFATWRKRTASPPTLWRVNSGGTFTPIAVLPTDCDFGSTVISMSRDGRRFVCVRTDAKRDIWLRRGLDLWR